MSVGISKRSLRRAQTGAAVGSEYSIDEGTESEAIEESVANQQQEVGPPEAPEETKQDGIEEETKNDTGTRPSAGQEQTSQPRSGPSETEAAPESQR